MESINHFHGMGMEWNLIYWWNGSMGRPNKQTNQSSTKSKCLCFVVLIDGLVALVAGLLCRSARQLFFVFFFLFILKEEKRKENKRVEWAAAPLLHQINKPKTNKFIFALFHWFKSGFTVIISFYSVLAASQIKSFN